MPATSLLVAGGMSVGVGLSFAAVARSIGRQPATGDARLALRAFATWWGALAVYLVVHGGLTAMAGFRDVPAALYLATRVLNIPALCLAIWGLTSYLLYLYVGDRRVFAVTGMFAAAVAVLFFWATFTADQVVHTGRWVVAGDDSGALYRLVYVALGVPPLVAALAYMGLARKVHTRAQRYRIVLVSGSILAYVGSGLAARLGTGDATVFATLVGVGALAAVAALMAYYPPPAVQRWLAGAPVPRGNLWSRAAELI